MWQGSWLRVHGCPMSVGNQSRLRTVLGLNECLKELLRCLLQTAGCDNGLACSAANSYSQKMYNWNTLNAKVCSRLNFIIPKHVCDAAAKAQPMAIERILLLMRTHISELEGDAAPTVRCHMRCFLQAPLP